ncbi:hypothetical protein B296_00045057 [Ensete ventricosum]|uniref:Uncharacterized protein n=1 Tax=Ensete ventricosum TaxID=4639 RepID=A0A426YG14_ENSVE|nr:hypothetical protein B296_00045057 [Ensete ventricosum]
MHKFAHKFEFRLVFHAPSQNFKILAIPNVLAHRKSYEYGFMKKRDGHKHCAKSSFDRFNRFFVHRLEILKILAIPNVLAQGNLYEHSFAKKCDDHKLCIKSRAIQVSFDFSRTDSEF